ncbi:MAG: ATP-binding protein, partial [Chloroflexi bacterium]|nr:ATP-binding protein [Chloroflexota bacterium]
YATTHGDGLQKMHNAIIDTVNRLCAQATREARLRPRQVYEAVFVGNTTMMHIFLGINPVELGGAPFALANRDGMDIKARDLGLRFHPSAHAYIMPAEAGHVGADNVGVLLAEAPYQQEKEVILIVDVGTNAEILLGNKAWMYSASSPTGPAFEGAQIQFGMRAAPGAIERVRIDPVSKIPRFRVIGEERWSDQWPSPEEATPETQPRYLAAGICGSGIIEVVAELYLRGILLKDGRFNPDMQNERLVWEDSQGAYILATSEESATGEAILVTQEDVRAIQLAKAALYAGAKLLMKHAGVNEVDRISLAGAFGSYIDPQHAMVLGLIPDCELSKVQAVGNAAGDGARIALLNRQKRQEAERVAHWVRYIETAADPDFQEEFVDAIHIPHQKDAFPHLQHILPSNYQQTLPRVRTRRHRRAKAAKT